MAAVTGSVCRTPPVLESVRATVSSRENKDLDDVEFQILQNFQVGSSVDVLGWSPKTTVADVSKQMILATAGLDYKLRIVSLNLKNDPKVQVLKGHTSFINSVAYEPNKGEQLASVGDDNTCRIWDENGDQVVRFILTSPGMSVCWHHEEPKKILVAQKNGIIRFFSLHNQRPIMSLDCGQTPLMSADWCHKNALSVIAAAGADWLFFDASVSSAPCEKRQVHSEGTKCIRWAKCSENLIATTGRPNCQIKIFNMQHRQVLFNQTLRVSYGLSWHYHLPILAAGGDKKVYFWLIELS